MSSIQHLFIESLSGGVLEAGDTKTTKIQPLIQRGHQKPHNYFLSPKLSVSSEFHILVDGNILSPNLEIFESPLTHFPSQLAFNPIPSLFDSTSKNSPRLCPPPLLSCCCWLGLHFVVFILNYYSKSLVIVFSALKSSPLLPAHPGPFVSSCSVKTKIVSYHFPIFKPFLNVSRTFEVAKTSAGATHKPYIPSRWYKREEKSSRWRMMVTSIKKLQHYSASVLWEQTFMFCQNFYLFFSHQKLEILIFIEVSCF